VEDAERVHELAKLNHVVLLLVEYFKDLGAQSAKGREGE
jgi:hypothetical protein